MKIVIDIPEATYKGVLESWGIYKHSRFKSIVDKAIVNGTVLPKGHGRLIDADAYIEKTAECHWLDDISVDEFNKITPTIIEADKETWDDEASN